jgi:hypothetical protein
VTKPKGVLDFETDPFAHGDEIKTFASCIYFGENDNLVIWSDDCSKQTYDQILELPPCELYAHNGGKFDFWYLWPWIEPGDVKIINGRIATCTIGNTTLIDSYLIAPIALSKYKKNDISYDKFRREVREQHRDEIIDYLISDCKHTLDLVDASHRILGKTLTIATAAMRSIRSTGLKIKKCGRAHDENFRPYFFGGRVEALHIGTKKFPKKNPAYYIDVNSAYLHAMTHDHAHGKKYSQTLKLPSKPGSWFAEIDAVSSGALPIRNEYKEILFPRDGETRTYKSTGWEIYAGLETKTLNIKKVLNVLKPKSSLNFSDFVYKHHGARARAKSDGDDLSALIHKTVGNSGYGKFAANPDKYYDWCVCEIGQDPRDYDGGDGYEWYSDVFGRSLWRRPASEQHKEESFFDVATAASITGYQRAVLWRALCAVKTPIYCDTDSIICVDVGELEIDQGALGAWKIESRPVETIICAKKIYCVTDAQGVVKIASKGARMDKNEIKLLSKNKYFKWSSKNPSFSVKTGFSYLEREIEIS